MLGTAAQGNHLALSRTAVTAGVSEVAAMWNDVVQKHSIAAHPGTLHAFLA
jgi:hypothetical protein